MIAIVILTLTTVFAVVGLALFRPGDSTALITTIIGVSAPVNISLIALIQRENHLATNSRMDELLSVARAPVQPLGTMPDPIPVKVVNE